MAAVDEGNVLRTAPVAPGSQLGASLNARPWVDLGMYEKLERLREVVKELQHSSGWHGKRIQDIASHLAALDEHTHEDCKVFIPIIGNHRYAGEKVQLSEKKIEGWF